MKESDKVKVTSVEEEDEKRAIQVGDLGIVELVQDDLAYVILKTGLAKGSIYTFKYEQLEAIK